MVYKCQGLGIIVISFCGTLINFPAACRGTCHVGCRGICHEIPRHVAVHAPWHTAAIPRGMKAMACHDSFRAAMLGDMPSVGLGLGVGGRLAARCDTSRHVLRHVAARRGTSCGMSWHVAARRGTSCDTTRHVLTYVTARRAARLAARHVAAWRAIRRGTSRGVSCGKSCGTACRGTARDTPRHILRHVLRQVLRHGMSRHVGGTGLIAVDDRGRGAAGGGGSIRLLPALVSWPLITHPFRDELSRRSTVPTADKRLLSTSPPLRHLGAHYVSSIDYIS